MKRYNRICYVATQYALLLYMIASTEQEIEDTFFVLDSYLPPANLKNIYKINQSNILRKSKLTRWIFYRYIKRFKIPKIYKNTLLFTQDHLEFASVLIGNMNYCVLEDSPRIFSNHFYESLDRKMNTLAMKNLTYPIFRILYGPIYLRNLGENEQCTEAIMTLDDTVPYMDNKKKILIDMDYKWHKMPKSQRAFILSTFGLESRDFDVLRNKSVIVFTQPLYPIITKDEQKDIYRKILSNYNIDGIVIKPHPNDDLNYEDMMPNISVFRKRIPSQLISLENISFDRAVTLFSTAVFGVNCKTIDWYGVKFNKKLFDAFGKVQAPENVNYCKF